MAAAEVYLFTGPENGEKGEAIANIREAARKKNGALDEYKYYASDTRLQDVISQLQNVSLFSSALFVVLRNAEQIKLKADIDLLASYIKGASDSPNTLILVSDENSVEKKLESLFATDHKKIFWEMFESDKISWIKNFFKKNEYSIEEDAVQLILNQYLSTFQRIVLLAMIYDELVQLGFNLWINGINRHRQRIYFRPYHLVGFLIKQQSVGTHTFE